MSDYRQTVTANLNDVKPGTQDEKVDTTPDNQEERSVQDQVAQEMTGNKEATVREESAPETKPDEPVSDEIPTNNDFDDGYIDLEAKESEDQEETKEDAQTEEEAPAEEENLTEEEQAALDKIKQEAKEQAFKEFTEKYKPNEQKSENIRLHKENQELQAKLNLTPTEFLIEEKKNEIYTSFFDRHKDILPEESKKNLLAYQKTGDETLVLGDQNLAKLNSKLQLIGQVNQENSLLDLDERLESAFWLSHKDEIIANAKRQELAKMEMARKKAERSVDPAGRPSSPTARQSGHSEAQQKVAEAWGIKL